MRKPGGDSWLALQDSVVYLAMHGFAWETTVDMDVLSFNDLYSSVLRISAEQGAERMFAIHIATQGQTKDVKKFIEQTYVPRMGEAAKKPDGADFIKKFGGGF